MSMFSTGSIMAEWRWNLHPFTRNFVKFKHVSWQNEPLWAFHKKIDFIILFIIYATYLIVLAAHYVLKGNSFFVYQNHEEWLFALRRSIWSRTFLVSDRITIDGNLVEAIIFPLGMCWYFWEMIWEFLSCNVINEFVV